jgi:hypothetical protein
MGIQPMSFLKRSMGILPMSFTGILPVVLLLLLFLFFTEKDNGRSKNTPVRVCDSRRGGLRLFFFAH